MSSAGAGSRASAWTEDPSRFLDTVRDVWITRVVPPEIDGYRPLVPIGRGGQGVVFRAEQLSTRRLVALKVLEEEVAASFRRGQRFELSMELVARLKHPNIAVVYDSGCTADGRRFLAMELVDGLALSECLPVGRRDSPLQTVGQGLALFRRIVDAVAYAHRNGVIHRDLKPSNILLDGGGEPKVVDFGLARPIDGGSLLAGATRTGEFLGSLAYASPEQLEGKQDAVDARTDVYALGAILYQMLAGRPPRSGAGSVTEVLRQITRGDVPPLAETRRRREEETGLPHLRIQHDLEAVVRRALAHDRDQRYATAEQLGEDIDRLRAGEPVTILRNRAGYVLLKAVQRHKLRTAAGAAALVLLTGFGLVYSSQRSQALASALERASLLEEVFETYDVMLRAAVDGTAQLAGAGPLRREIVEAAYASYSDFHDRYPDDLEVRFLLAQICDRLASIERAEGQVEKAGRLQRQALANHRALLEADPLRPEWRGGMSLNLVKLGDLDKEAGRSDLAYSLYLEALEVDRELVREFPDNLHFKDNLFWSLQRLGVLAERAGLGDAEEFYRGLLPLAESVARLDPGRPASVALLYEANHILAEWAKRNGDPEDWMALSRAAVTQTEKLMELEPWRPGFQQKHVIALRALGDACRGAGNQEQGYVCVLQAEEAIRALVAAEPDVLDYQLDLFLVLRQRADFLTCADDFESADQALAEAIAVADRLYAAAPDNPGHSSAPALAIFQRSTLREAAGRLEEAKADAELAVEMFREQCLAHPSRSRFERMLAGQAEKFRQAAKR